MALALPWLVSVLADGLVALGFAVVCLALRESRHAGTASQEPAVLMTGLYGLVRHPMYAGTIVLLIFSPPALGSWPALPFALALVMVIVARTREEDDFLSANLAGYAAYRQTVRYRLLPFVW